MTFLVSVPVLSVNRWVTNPSSSLMSDVLHLGAASGLSGSRISRSQEKNMEEANFCTSMLTYMLMGMTYE